MATPQARSRRYGGLYTPGYSSAPRFRNAGGAPQPGFSLAPRQASLPVNDPYTRRSEAADLSQLWQALTTEAGRQAIGA